VGRQAVAARALVPGEGIPEAKKGPQAQPSMNQTNIYIYIFCFGDKVSLLLPGLASNF
jgi:hypothetical protein